MARPTYKITLLFLWVILVREVLTQGQTLPDTAAPELQGMILGSNQESENDAIAMGRNAAEDMGALMASLPIKMFRLPQMTSDNQQKQQQQQYDSRLEFSKAREAMSAPRPTCNLQSDTRWYPSSEPSGRSAVARTIPMAPLPPLPLVPGLSPLPLLSPLIQSLANPGRLGLGFGARPFLRTAFPYTMPALRTPLPYTLPALRNPLSTYKLPRMSRARIPPSTLRARSSFTPNSYARSANQYKPLVFYN